MRRRVASSSGGSGSVRSPSGIGSGARARAIRACNPTTNTWSASGHPPGRGEYLHRAGGRRARSPRRSGSSSPEPDFGEGAQRARELTRRWPAARGPRSAAASSPKRRERAQPLDDVGLGGEQLLAAQPEPLDQPMDVEVGPRRVDRAMRAAVELQEDADPLARLRRDLRGLERRRHRARPCRACAGARSGCSGRCRPSAARSAAGQARARPRAASVGIGQQPQPGEQVADLGALEERGLPDHAVRRSPAPRARPPPPGPRAARRGRSPRPARASTPSRAISRSISAATAWACGPLAGAAPEPRRRRPRRRRLAGPPGRVARPSAALRRARHAGAGSARSRRRSIDVHALRPANPPGARRPHRGSDGPRGRVAGHGERRRPERSASEAAAKVELLGVVDQQVVERGAPSARRRCATARASSTSVALVAGARPRRAAARGSA